MDDRFTIANMAIEAGAKNGIFPVDEKTIDYIMEHSKKPYQVFEADEDAEYESTVVMELDKLEPTVSFPHLPENTRLVKDSGDVELDQDGAQRTDEQRNDDDQRDGVDAQF